MPARLKSHVPSHRRKTATMRVKTCNQAYASRDYRKAREAALLRDGYVCSMCGCKLEGFNATADHIVPLAQGGDPLDVTNLRAACRSCNSSKGKRTTHRGEEGMSGMDAVNRRLAPRDREVHPLPVPFDLGVISAS